LRNRVNYARLKANAGGRYKVRVKIKIKGKGKGKDAQLKLTATTAKSGAGRIFGKLVLGGFVWRVGLYLVKSWPYATF
jgi:hypothetical protein